MEHLLLKYGYLLLFLGVAVLAEALQSSIIILEPDLDPLTPHAARFLGSVQIAGWLARLYLLVLLLRPVVLRHRQKVSHAELERLFQAHGHYSLSAFAVQDDKNHLIAAEGRGLLGYATRGAVALTCGDLIAAEEDLEKSVRHYLEHCRKHGWTPCIYEAAEEHVPLYRSLRLKSLKIAEEALAWINNPKP
jgi:lysylphosphatidylglycerol synthetase-like protein (DUF2156 family)